jgi:CBS domain-containing protein
MLLLADMKRIPRAEWYTTSVRDVMRIITPDHFVDMQSPLSQARELMLSNGVGAVGVIDDHGKLVGFLHVHGPRKNL